MRTAVRGSARREHRLPQSPSRSPHKGPSFASWTASGETATLDLPPIDGLSQIPYDIAWSGTGWIATHPDEGIWLFDGNTFNRTAPIGGSFLECGDNTCLVAGYGETMGASDDGGETWQQLAHSSVIPMANDGSRFVAYDNNTGGLAYSDDGGDTWTPANVEYLIFTPFVGMYADGAFILIDGGGNVITSPDGIDWTVTAVGVTLQNVTWSESQQIYVGYDSFDLYASEDGVTWIHQPDGAGGVGLQAIGGI